LIIKEKSSDQKPSVKKLKFKSKKGLNKYISIYVKKKIKAGFSTWQHKETTVDENSVSTNVEESSSENEDNNEEKNTESNDDENNEEVEDTLSYREPVEIPDGFIEVKKDFAEKIDETMSLLAAFMKQAKSTGAIRNIRNMVKNYQCYKPIQYKINVALDHFDDKGIPVAKWSSQKGNRLINLMSPSNDQCVMIKASNLKIIFGAMKDMVWVLEGLIQYYDTRSHAEVQMTKRKMGGKILLRPKLKPVIRFFVEGIELKNRTILLVREFQDDYPEESFAVMR
jgi:hypothetical protein